MGDEVEKIVEETIKGHAVFIPSHLTKALIATGVAVGAGGVSVLAGAYALYEFRRTNIEEIAAMIKPPKG